MNVQELIEAVLVWGEEKGIVGAYGKGTLLGQLAKTQEELDEAWDAAVKVSAAKHNPDSLDSRDKHMHDLADGIGDTTVTLILAAEMAGLSFEGCLQQAYDEIKGRTGKMIDGQFVKEVKP